MSNNQHFIRLFLIILFSTGFIFSLSYFVAAAFDNSNISGRDFSAGTSIGFIDVSGKNKAEVSSLIEEKYVDWLKNTKIVLQYQEKSVSFNQIKKDTVIRTANIVLKEVPEDLQVLVDHTQKIEISREGTFSLLGLINEKKVNVQAETLNIVATGIYQAILPSNFTVVERNISSSLPVYAQLGFEAKVNKGTNEDLVFTNPNKEKYYLDLHLENNKLVVTLKGEQLLYSYKISKKDEQILEPKTIIQFSPLISPGNIKVQNSGANGKIVKLFRDVYQGNQLLKSEFISEDYYPPAYRVEIHSLTGGVNTVTQPVSTQSDNSGLTTNLSNSTIGTTSATTTTDVQPVSNETNLWGTPNEQPK